jgi:hypothetical protein
MIRCSCLSSYKHECGRKVSPLSSLPPRDIGPGVSAPLALSSPHNAVLDFYAVPDR